MQAKPYYTPSQNKNKSHPDRFLYGGLHRPLHLPPAPAISCHRFYLYQHCGEPEGGRAASVPLSLWLCPRRPALSGPQEGPLRGTAATEAASAGKGPFRRACRECCSAEPNTAFSKVRSASVVFRNQHEDALETEFLFFFFLMK